jgi:hypothetical protein
VHQVGCKISILLPDLFSQDFSFSLSVFHQCPILIFSLMSYRYTVLATDSIVSDTRQSNKYVIAPVLTVTIKANKADKVLTAFTRFPLCFWHLAVLNSHSSVHLRTFPKYLQFVTAVTLVTDIATHFVTVGDSLLFLWGQVL